VPRLLTSTPDRLSYTCTETTSPLYLPQLKGTVNGNSTAVIEMSVKYLPFNTIYCHRYSLYLAYVQSVTENVMWR